VIADGDRLDDLFLGVVDDDDLVGTGNGDPAGLAAIAVLASNRAIRRMDG
jgi:hypothetical protein